ncbi:diaminobutyrate acetyltransferase [Aurantivibrio plasticivorans]
MDNELLAEQVITLRAPTALDGAHVHRLVSRCPPLDPNSVYCNLLQCSHFASTSVAAVLDGELVGFVSGYVIPEKPHVLFVWQVAVGEAARGRGLATKMVSSILARDTLKSVTHIETTITEDNQASWNLFRGLAKAHSAELSSEVFFSKEEHFLGEHDSEHLVSIGPLART